MIVVSTYQNETTHAEHGKIIKPNFGRNWQRPNSATVFFKDLSGLRIRTNEFIQKNKPTMRIRITWRKIQRILPT